MKAITEKVYHCEHCKKYMLSASSMSRHEKYCRMNPNNKHKCFDLCRHLQKSRVYGTIYHGVTQFRCAITGEKMYSYLLEKKQTAYFGNKINFDGLIRMPLECNDYRIMSFEEQEKRFNTEIDD